MNLEDNGCLALRALRTELACARALLDALETLLDRENEERTRGDVVVQVADYLASVASTLKHRGPKGVDAATVLVVPAP